MRISTQYLCLQNVMAYLYVKIDAVKPSLQRATINVSGKIAVYVVLSQTIRSNSHFFALMVPLFS